MTVKEGRGKPQTSAGQQKRTRVGPTEAPDNVDASRHDRIVERMLELHKRLVEVRTEHDKEVLRRQIQATDEEIDRLFYELYGVTEAETCQLSITDCELWIEASACLVLSLILSGYSCA